MIEAIDVEIASANEQRKLDGLNSWVISVAIAALLGITATLLEADHLRWSYVSAYFIVLTLAADVVASLLTWEEPYSQPLPSRSPFRLWFYPRAPATLQQLLLILLVWRLRAWVPTWTTITALGCFSVVILGELLMDSNLLRTLAGFAAVQNKLSIGERAAPLVNASVHAYRFAKLAGALTSGALIVAYTRMAPVVQQGASLRDVRFAVASFLLMVLVGRAIAQRESSVAAELKLLRHDLLFAKMSPADAAAIMFALVAGAHSARAVFNACTDSLARLSRCESDAEIMLTQCAAQNNSLHSADGVQRLLAHFASVDSIVRRLLPVATTTTLASQLVRSVRIEVLSIKIAELQSAHKLLMTHKAALQKIVRASEAGASGRADGT